MGNFSRPDTFDALKHYVGVRLQQGVPLVDADWNELEDIRRYELRSFLRWFVGDGVPAGNDGFRIEAVGGNDFGIGGGDGTADGAGRCLVSGWEVRNEARIRYSEQPGVDPLPGADLNDDRWHTVYLDVWEREVDSTEDPSLVDSRIGIETCVRIKLDWVVRVATGVPGDRAPLSLPAALAGHEHYLLAYILRPAGQDAITSGNIFDRRRTGLSMAAVWSVAKASMENRPPLTAPTPITDDLAYDRSPLAVRAHDDGLWVFWWSDRTNPSGEYGLWAKRYDQVLGTWGAELEVVPNVGAYWWRYRVAAAPSSNGDILLFWYEYYLGGVVSCKRFDQTSGVWEAQQDVVTDLRPAGWDEATVATASDAIRGDVWVLWEVDVAGTGRDIRYRQYDAATSTWGTPGDVDVDVTDDSLPAATVDGFGSLWVFWRRSNETTPPTPPGLFYRKRLTDGTWEASAQLVTNTDDIQAIAAASWSDDRRKSVHVAWIGVRDERASCELSVARSWDGGSFYWPIETDELGVGGGRNHWLVHLELRVHDYWTCFAQWDDIGRLAGGTKCVLLRGDGRLLGEWNLGWAGGSGVFLSDGTVWIFNAWWGSPSVEIVYRKLLPSMYLP